LGILAMLVIVLRTGLVATTRTRLGAARCSEMELLVNRLPLHTGMGDANAAIATAVAWELAADIRKQERVRAGVAARQRFLAETVGGT
jgi:hypothetical protein